MTGEMLFGGLYSLFMVGIFCASLVVMEGVYAFLYRFIPPFRRMMDKLCGLHRER